MDGVSDSGRASSEIKSGAYWSVDGRACLRRREWFADAVMRTGSSIHCALKTSLLSVHASHRAQAAIAKRMAGQLAANSSIVSELRN